MGSERQWLEDLTKCFMLRQQLLSTPGDRIKEQMVYYRINKGELRFFLGLSRAKLDKLLEGKLRIDWVLARRLERLFSIDSSFWLNLEQQYQHELLELEKLQLELEVLSPSIAPGKRIQSLRS